MVKGNALVVYPNSLAKAVCAGGKGVMVDVPGTIVVRSIPPPKNTVSLSLKGTPNRKLAPDVSRE
jgi:hypothetical protein